MLYGFVVNMTGNNEFDFGFIPIQAMVVIKYLFQFDFFPWNEKSKQVNTKPFWPPKILGIEKQEKYAMFDVILLMVVFFHRWVIRTFQLCMHVDRCECEPQ